MGGAGSAVHAFCALLLQNYDLRTVQTGYRKAMLQQALEYESQEAEKQEVTAEAVEEAMLERLQLARDMETALEGCQYFFTVLRFASVHWSTAFTCVMQYMQILRTQ